MLFEERRFIDFEELMIQLKGEWERYTPLKRTNAYGAIASAEESPYHFFIHPIDGRMRFKVNVVKNEYQRVKELFDDAKWIHYYRKWGGPFAPKFGLKGDQWAV